MKNFIGVKILQAKPMTRGEYNAYRNWTMPKDKNPNDPGYLVKYPGSYESWSPKEVFESAYFEMGDDPSTITPDMVDRFADGRIVSDKIDGKTTLLCAESITGFVQYETSSCVDPENYDEKIGTEICMKRIKDTIWQCLGFVLQWGKCGLNGYEK